MDIKQLIEKMEEFAGEKVGQKPGDQWKGTDKGTPGKKLVGASESVLKDLSKGKTPKTREQELSEEFQAFLEAEFKDTVDKRPARKNARHSRGHEPQPRYKTVKTENWSQLVEFTPEIVNLLKSKGYRGPYELNTVKKLYKELNGLVSGISGNDLIMIKGDSFVIPSGSKFLVGAEGQVGPATVKQLVRHLSESSMSEKDIELQDYRSMSHKEFQTAYGMTKTEWISKNKSLVITNPNIKKGLGLDEGAEQDPIVATVVKQMRPGLTGLNMGNEAFLYFAYELGKQRARDAWEDYLPAIRDAYEQGLNEDANTDNKLAKLLTRFINQHEGTDRAVALDAIEYIKKIGHIEQFATSLDYFAVDLDESSEEDSSVEARWMVKVSDDEGDHLKTYHRKFPTLSAAKKAYKNTPYATDFKYKPVKKDQVKEAVVGQDSFNRAGYNPIRDERDYLKKLSDLSNLSRKPGLDQQMKDQIKQRILDLNAEARKKGFIQAESRGHNIIANKLKDVERAKKFASGELKIPTPQERQAQLKKLEKEPKQVKEYGASLTSSPTSTTPGTDDVKKAMAATSTLKTATGTSQSAPLLMKAMDTISQGKTASSTDMMVAQNTLQDINTAFKEPELANQLKPILAKANQLQQKK